MLNKRLTLIYQLKQPLIKSPKLWGAQGSQTIGHALFMIGTKSICNFGLLQYTDAYLLTENFPLIAFYYLFQILTALGTENSRPSSAAQCVAYVAVVELPQGKWPELIQILVNNVLDPNSTEMVREATLETIGYICQDIVSQISSKLYFQCAQRAVRVWL